MNAFVCAGPRRKTALAVGATMALLVLALSAPVATAGEIVPQIGITRSVHGEADAQVFGGLAVRGKVAPFLKSEVGLAYRSEELSGGDVTVRMWPLTASLWATPLPTLYVGGGVGWYHTTLEYEPSLGLVNETEQEFGVHLGGGFAIPLAPMAAIDLQGRYIFMDDQQSQLPPNEFDPDFWSTSVGLAIRF